MKGWGEGERNGQKEKKIMNKEKEENRIPKTNEKLKNKKSKVRNMWVDECNERKVGLKEHKIQWETFS